jgi:hypothetical protein
MVKTGGAYPVNGAPLFTERKTMRLSEAVINYGNAMYFLAMAECKVLNHDEGSAMRKQRQAELERSRVEVAKAKSDFVEYQTKNRKTSNWKQGEIDEFLKPKVGNKLE